ncbi:MAG: Ig-like domain-containing domain [Cyclobacteriaceae bacterium]|nr:Ig-like domain-containing domain [Cyclobacteriaceae bacterium]
MKWFSRVWMIVAMLTLSCAQQSVPTGGEKDAEGPKLIASEPTNRQTHYKKEEIILWFDEFIQLNNPREQIIIVPAVDKKNIEVTARKNKVIVRFKEPLKDSTTYTVNFRESIQDITERNVATNLKLAFSTGPVIDTLEVKGVITQLMTGEPEPNCTVALLPFSDTVDIFKYKPEYFTLTEKDGSYEISNVRPGNYLIYAFQDRNKNLIIDSRTEMFGFRSSTLNLSNINFTIDLSLIKLDMRPLKFVSARPIAQQFIIRLNKGLEQFHVKPLDSTKAIYFDTPEPGLIRIYNTFTNQDSVAIQCNFRDSIQNIIDTLIYARFLKQNSIFEKFSIQGDEILYNSKLQIITGNFRFTKPVEKINSDSIYISTDSVNKIHVTEKNLLWNLTRTECKLTLKTPEPLNFDKPNIRRTLGTGPKEKAINQLILKKGAFISVEKDSSHESIFRINELKENERAVLLYQINSDKRSITELYQKDKTLMRGHEEKGKFEYINPGEYRLRVIIDNNRNGKWDWGNFYQLTEPEPVYHYEEKGKKDIPLKANWEVGPLLISIPNNVDNSK